ncbi:outer membrane beta-barrel protein [Saccharicrinis sp. FJH54]|uniref:outer membrane beta-barrel protein n=1 Tax=Saccharicrinis sp. FJH54 TaxID=3344665 RepID=UPI0035D4F8E2
MKRLTVLLGGLFVFIWSISAQDTTKLDVGTKGEVTVVNKGTSTVITIDADSLNQVIETVASELVESMNLMLKELSVSMDKMSKELDKAIKEQNAIDQKEQQLMADEQQKMAKEQVEARKKELEAQKMAMKEQQSELREQMIASEQEYRKQLAQMEQYKKVKDAIMENRDELENINGKVTIEIAEPVLKSTSITKKSNADTTEVKIVGKSVVKVVDGNDASELAIGGYNNIYIADKGGDTVEVRLGKKMMRVTDINGKADVSFDRIQKDDDEEAIEHHVKKGKFKGHWSTFDLGMNTFTAPDYSMYGANPGFTPTNEFMELNYNKSVEVNINPFHFNLGIINGRTQHSAKMGIVAGLGFNFNNYTFDNNLTLAKMNNRIEPVDLGVTENIEAKKTKLTTSYLTVPVMLEITLPGGDAFISAGAIGALKLGSHTKYKTSNVKEKNHGDFYLNPFRYGFTARIGYKGLSLYGTYYVSELFQENKGPLTTPFSVGIGIM